MAAASNTEGSGKFNIKQISYYSSEVGYLKKEVSVFPKLKLIISN